MVIFAVLTIWFAILVAPETPIGRAFQRWTIEKPARQLNRVTRGHLIFVVLLASGVSLVGWLIGHEAVRMMAMGLPDLLAMATMLEVTAYLDAIAAIIVAASTARSGAIKAWIRSIALPRRTGSRAPRTRRPTREAANDASDEPAPLGIAA